MQCSLQSSLYTMIAMTIQSDISLDEDRPTAQQQAAFDADLAKVLNTIVDRYVSKGADLTWQLVRDIQEETFADLGLAARWPVEMIDCAATQSDVPPFDGSITDAEAGGLSRLARVVAAAFRKVRAEARDLDGA